MPSLDQPLKVAGEQVADSGVCQVQPGQVLAPVAPGRPDQPVGVLAGQRGLGADEERGQPDARPAGRCRGSVSTSGGQRPEPLRIDQPLAQAGTPSVVDLHHVDGQVVLVEGAQVLHRRRRR